MKKQRVYSFLTNKEYEMVKYYSDKNNKSVSKTIVIAINHFFTNESNWDILWKRLNRNQTKYDRLHDMVMVLAEEIALFLKYFFILTPELSMEEKQQATDQGLIRYQKFMTLLKKNLGDGGLVIIEKTLNEIIEKEK